MKNIFLIIQREYLTRVKKRSFLVMTIVGPLLLAIMYGGMIYMALREPTQKKVEVIDETNLFSTKFKNSKENLFSFNHQSIEDAKKLLKNNQFDALIFIPKDVFENPNGVKIFSEKGVSLDFQSGIENLIENEIENIKLTEAGITQSVLQGAKVKISAETISIQSGQEKKSSAGAATAIGYICGFMIYMSVMIYGVQVMRGITEEKTSRIVEVIISSVKPFQLMIGKIVGVALVGLTQFALWIILSLGIMSIGGKIMGDKLLKTQEAMTNSQMANLPPEAKAMAKEKMQQQMSTVMPDVLGAVSTLPLATIIVSFLCYFMGGYMLYSAMFGAVGSAVDSDTDTQQFMLPITLPIVAAFMIAQFVGRDPNSSLAFWSSMIPFTSPIVMMVRIPFGVPVWQIILSLSILVASFIFTTYLASRIYRVGILMYGKKPTWKEMWKWMFYKG